jgi:Restriction endonuclease
MTTNNLDWKTYESITKYIYELLGKQSGVKIIGYGNSCNVTGKSGVSHQIDVLTMHSDGIHSYQTAIECKYWKDKVNKDIVMKLSETIEDTGINKGIIVSKNGFSQDGIEYAKYRNIGLVELREIEEKDFDKNPKEIEIAHLEIQIRVHIKRPEVLRIDIGNDRNIEIKDEFHFYNFAVIREDKSHIPLINYINGFRKEVNLQNKMSEKIIKHYKISNGALLNVQTKESLKIDGITFTGQLIQIDDNRDVKFTLVDQVWLIMKSIFDERTFSFSENGAIKENKK